jgi:hypothetical protein
MRHAFQTRMVELLGRYSGIAKPSIPWHTNSVRRGPSTPSRVHALNRRLSSEARAALVADDESGVSANQLAKQHQLSHCSIRRLLRESGIARRHLAMSEADVEQAVQLYTSGQTIAAVADQLGRPAQRCRRRLADVALSPGDGTITDPTIAPAAADPWRLQELDQTPEIRGRSLLWR